MATTYKPAKGALYNAKQAKALGQMLERLGDHVTPQQIVEAARPVRSPIHALFEWNDSAAAEAFRLWQARCHVNHLEIVITTPEGDIETRAYHSVVITKGEERQRGYAHMADIRRSEVLSRQVVAKALSELEGWQQRYSEYQSIFGEVFQAIDHAKRNGRTKRQTAKKRMKAVA